MIEQTTLGERDAADQRRHLEALDASVPAALLGTSDLGEQVNIVLGHEPTIRRILRKTQQQLIAEAMAAAARSGAAPEPDAEVTYRTLADIDDSAPEPLLLGMIEPDGPTVLNASGGTGKGTTGAWMIHALLELGIRTLIYDAENRPREWARRTSGLGVDRRRVAYLQPTDLPRPLLGRPLWEIAPHIGKVAAASGARIVLIDSIMPAVGVGEDRLKSDAQVPYLYVAALDALGLPSVSFAHPPKGQPNGDPFGSVAWVNAPRLTWQGTTGESSQHRVRWRPRKRNERGHIPGVLLTFEYGIDGRLSAAAREDDDEATRDWILGALVHRTATIYALAELLFDEMEDSPTAEERQRGEDRIGRMLRRMERDDWVRKEGKEGRADRWALSLEKSR